MGHSDKFYPCRFEAPVGTLVKLYGDWMRVQPRRTSHMIGKKWLKQFRLVTEDCEMHENQPNSDHVTRANPMRQSMPSATLNQPAVIKEKLGGQGLCNKEGDIGRIDKAKSVEIEWLNDAENANDQVINEEGDCLLVADLKRRRTELGLSVGSKVKVGERSPAQVQLDLKNVDMDLVIQKKPNFVFLCETLCKRDQVEKARVFLGFDSMFVMDVKGRNGGIALLWRHEEEASKLGFADNYIDMEVTVEGQPKWRFTGLYGEPNRSRRRATWDLIRTLAVKYNLPWGRGTDGWIEVRLDRGLVNQSWLDIFNLAKLYNLETTISDHYLIFMDLLTNLNSQTAKQNLVETYAQREVFWRQRSKQMWLQDGDNNNKFFHASASARRRTNSIQKLKNSAGHLVDWNTGLPDVMKDYFTALFASAQTDWREVTTLVQSRVTTIQNEDLLRTVTHDEVIANRLKAILPSIISETQSAFLQGRLISNNIMISCEIMHYLKRKRRGRDGFMALQLDMSKAYDRLEWGYLRAMLERMGFDGRWINLVMWCVSFVSFSIVHGGHGMGPIEASRWIRQGDPLSPYLFILCAKGFSCLLQSYEQSGLLTGWRVYRARYYPNNSFLKAEFGDNPSFVWQSIFEAKELLNSGVCRSIGLGFSISILNDPWLPDDETIYNVLVDCSFTRSCWNRSVVDIGNTMVADFFSWLQEIESREKIEEMEELAMVAWATWRARNEVVWQQKSSNAASTVASARSFLDQYKTAQERRGNSLSHLFEDGNKAEHWLKPSRNKIKVNVDGALFANEGRFGMGCLARESGTVKVVWLKLSPWESLLWFNPKWRRLLV
uniref:Reverse transcriptase domain-containing protein n=1 Tax=Cannabis sativa TaxID=3483 RepID=A0A803NRR4_CANSA